MRTERRLDGSDLFLPNEAIIRTKLINLVAGRRSGPPVSAHYCHVISVSVLWAACFQLISSCLLINERVGRNSC